MIRGKDMGNVFGIWWLVVQNSRFKVQGSIFKILGLGAWDAFF